MDGCIKDDCVYKDGVPLPAWAQLCASCASAVDLLVADGRMACRAPAPQCQRHEVMHSKSLIFISCGVLQRWVEIALSKSGSYDFWVRNWFDYVNLQSKFKKGFEWCVWPSGDRKQQTSQPHVECLANILIPQGGISPPVLARSILLFIACRDVCTKVSCVYSPLD